METTDQECPNCRKMIAQQTWLIHQNVCARHNYFCDVCEQVISITATKDHETVCPDRYIPCTACDELVRNASFKDHQLNDCEMRMVNCKYCELGQSFRELQTHQQCCGSRTRECEKCSKRVQLKNFDAHSCQLPNVSLNRNSNKSVRFDLAPNSNDTNNRKSNKSVRFDLPPNSKSVQFDSPSNRNSNNDTTSSSSSNSGRFDLPPNNSSSNATKSKNDYTCECPFCEKSFKDEFNMQEHIFTEHAESL